MKTKYGILNAPLLALGLKEIMRRATFEVHKRRAVFEAKEKVNELKPNDRDVVTDADLASQRIFVNKLTECFPGFGIIAEEKGFDRDCTLEGEKLYFTVDPLDGTKAFERKQSQGFGPMLSLCDENEVLAAFVGDSMTLELYYYRPESDKVHRLHLVDNQHQLLGVNEDLSLASQYVLLRDNPQSLPVIYQQMFQSQKFGGIFKEIEIAGGGIGTGMARLWKGEVGAYVVKAGTNTPWDLLPVWGISEKLGFVWLYHTELQGWRCRSITPQPEHVRFDEPTVIIHQSRVEEFMRRSIKYMKQEVPA